jgi:serine phosphatase RsbU (regulator of sigma subunit)
MRLLLTIILAFQLILLGENHKIDSLKKIIENESGKSKVELLIKLSSQYIEKNPDSCLVILENSAKYSKSINYSQGLFDSYSKIGELFSEYEEPDSSLYYFNLCLDLANELTEKNIGYLYNNIGVAYTNLEKFEDAAKYFQKALDIYIKIDDRDAAVRNYENLAIIYEITYEFDKSVYYAIKADSVFALIGDDFQRATNLARLAGVYQNKSEFIKSVDTYHKALNLYENIKDTNGITICVGNIGVIYDVQTEYDKAIEYYQRALELCKKIDDLEGQAINLLNIATININNEPERSLDLFLQSLDIYKKLDNKDGIATILGNIGIIYENDNNFVDAIIKYQEAVEIYEEIGDYEGLGINTGNIGSLYLSLATGKDSLDPEEISKFKSEIGEITLDSTIKIIKKSIDYLQSGYLDTRQLYLFNLSEAYRIKGNYKLADKYMLEYDQLKDSVYNIQKSKELASLTAQRDKIEKEKEILLLKEREKAQAHEKMIITYSATGGILMIGLFSIMIYFRLRKEKKLSKELDKKNIFIEEANIELETQQKELEKNHYELIEKNEEILASIRYAQTIQNAMLPWQSTLKKHLNYFLIFKPKDIVSGDFYWFKKLDDGFLMAVSDCTGHGVPGSMISMMGSSILDEAVSQGIKDTGQILSYLNSKMIKGLNKQEVGNKSRDGMDICLVRVLNNSTKGLKKTTNVQFSGAKRPLFINQDGELLIIKGDRNSIAGERHLDDKFEFVTNELQIIKGSIIFLTSDGFVDQIGFNGKKFGTKNLKKLLKAEPNINNIGKILEEEFVKHKGSENQRDDVTVLGIEV